MASQLNRTAIILTLAASVGVSILSISFKAPIIQQDILKRCQDALAMNRISIKGLAVDGRDVILSGPYGSDITSPLARTIVNRVSGVRVVMTHVLPGTEAMNPDNTDDDGDDASAPPSPASLAQQDIQEKIDGLLDNPGITFKTDTATLSADSQASLEKIAGYLSLAPNLICEIRAFDMPSAARRENWALAFQRALATQDYLEMRGIADWRLSTRAFHVGENSPDGRKSGRQVDLVVKARR